MPGKKFRFSLDRVLTFRGHQADRAQREVERAEAAVQAQRAVCDAVQRRLDDVAAPATTLADLRHRDAFRQQLRDERDEAQRTLERLEAEHAQKQAAYLLRYREKETLETLRDGEHARHRQAVQHAENAFLDEQATLGHARRRRLPSAP